MPTTKTVTITVTAKNVNGEISMESLQRWIRLSEQEMHGVAVRNFGPDVEVSAEIKL